MHTISLFTGAAIIFAVAVGLVLAAYAVMRWEDYRNIFTARDLADYIRLRWKSRPYLHRPKSDVWIRVEHRLPRLGTKCAVYLEPENSDPSISIDTFDWTAQSYVSEKDSSRWKPETMADPGFCLYRSDVKAWCPIPPDQDSRWHDTGQPERPAAEVPVLVQGYDKSSPGKIMTNVSVWTGADGWAVPENITVTRWFQLPYEEVEARA